MGLKVSGIREWITSHILLVGGLALLTVGLVQEGLGLVIAGIWAFALGLSIGFGAAFRKLMAK